MLASLLFWGIPATARHADSRTEESLSEKSVAPEISAHPFKMHDAAVHQEIKALKKQPQKSLPLLPFALKKPSLNVSYKGLPYGAGPTTSTGSVKSKKAKMVVVRINPDGSTDEGSGDEGDEDSDDDEDDEEDPYLKVKILERKRDARIEEERAKTLAP